MLTKKDFIKVAEILRENFPVEEKGKLSKWHGRDIRIILANEFCKWFKSENPNFDEQKFKDAVLKEK